MSNLLEIVRSGLTTTQDQLNVVGNNIANVHSDGYHKQMGEQTPFVGGDNHPYYLDAQGGGGVFIRNVKRAYDQFAEREQRIAHSQHGLVNTSHAYLERLDQMFSLVGKKITNSMNVMFESTNQMIDLPSDISARENFLINATTVTENFHQFNRELYQHFRMVNEEIEKTVADINSDAVRISFLNNEISGRGSSNFGMLDERTALLNELSQKVSTQILGFSEADVNVVAGLTQPIVLDNFAIELEIRQGQSFNENTTLHIKQDEKNLELDTSVIGGRLQALFTYRDEVLRPAVEAVDMVAIGLTQAFNDVQMQGFDLRGQVAKPMFSDINHESMMFYRSQPHIDNEGGSLIGEVTIEDYTQITGDNYKLVVDKATIVTRQGVRQIIQINDHGEFRLVNNNTGEVHYVDYPKTSPATVLELDALKGQPMMGLVGDPQMVDGFNFTLEHLDLLKKGDSFNLRPMRGAARHIELLLDYGEQVAVARGMAADVDSNQSLTLTLDAIDRTNTDLQDRLLPGYQLSLTFQEATTPGLPHVFQVDVLDDKGFSVPFDPINPTVAYPEIVVGSIEVPPVAVNTLLPTELNYFGLSLSLEGTLTNGDNLKLNVDFGEGDNLNAEKFADLAHQKLMKNKKQTLFDMYEGTTTNIGTRAGITALNLETVQVSLDYAQGRVQETSGVNLDEEAADMVKYQQIYMATSRIMNTAGVIIEAMLALR
jgi:flagellar hook-associated protein 1